MDNKKNFLSILIKLAIIISVIVGLVLTFLHGEISGVSALLYFTVQSNLWIAIWDFVMIIILIISITKPNYEINNNLLLVQQVFTVCITITGFVFCAILVPGFYASSEPKPAGYTPFNAAAVLLHMVVPILAIIDFFAFTRGKGFKKVDCFWAGIPTIYYLLFSLTGYFLHWDFGGGRNYPYFFLNYDSPAGVFGFSKEMPYFMGSFYWILIMVLLVFGLSYFYIAMNHLLVKKKLKS